jgi:hypothetical protein
MDKKLRLLVTFLARGDDGAACKVMAYEPIRHVDPPPDGQRPCKPTGLTESRLAADGRVDLASDAAMPGVADRAPLRLAVAGRARCALAPPARAAVAHR